MPVYQKTSIVQVWVNDLYITYALLDTALSNTFCTKRLVNHLGIRGSTEKIMLDTLNRSESRESQIVNMKLSNEGETLPLLKVCVLDDIPIKNTYIHIQEYPH